MVLQETRQKLKELLQPLVQKHILLVNPVKVVFALVSLKLSPNAQRCL